MKETIVFYSSDWREYNTVAGNRPSHSRLCINGEITGSNKCVGYCQYYGHPGFLTKEQRKQHDCINKKCNYYIEKRKRESRSKKVNEEYQETYTRNAKIQTR